MAKVRILEVISPVDSYQYLIQKRFFFLWITVESFVCFNNALAKLPIYDGSKSVKKVVYENGQKVYDR